MKLHEVESINEHLIRFKVMESKLVFLASICPLTGESGIPLRQPDQWDQVKRLTNKLFLAWDDTNPLEGTVYLGDFFPENT